MYTAEIKSTYETLPDLWSDGDHLYMTYTEAEDIETTTYTRLLLKTFSEDALDRTISLGRDTRGVPYWHNPRFLKGASEPIVFFVSAQTLHGHGDIVYFCPHTSGDTEYIETGIEGSLCSAPLLLPSGKVLLLTFEKNPQTGYYQEWVHMSFPSLKDWRRSARPFHVDGCHFIGSELVLLDDGTLMALLRNAADDGWDLYQSLSRDEGETWTKPVKLPFKGGHKPCINRCGDNLTIGFGRDLVFAQKNRMNKDVLLNKVSLELVSGTPRKSVFETLKVQGPPVALKSDFGISGITRLNDGCLWVSGYLQGQNTGLVYVKRLDEV